MLHDRFYREWAQPTTVVASGAKISALAKIRIEKDGRISDFKIVRSSGNVVIDESVEAVGKKVTRVDALPAGVGNGGHYDVNINFALNSNRTHPERRCVIPNRADDEGSLKRMVHSRSKRDPSPSARLKMTTRERLDETA